MSILSCPPSTAALLRRKPAPAVNLEHLSRIFNELSEVESIPKIPRLDAQFLFDKGSMTRHDKIDVLYQETLILRWWLFFLHNKFNNTKFSRPSEFYTWNMCTKPSRIFTRTNFALSILRPQSCVSAYRAHSIFLTHVRRLVSVSARHCSCLTNLKSKGLCKRGVCR